MNPLARESVRRSIAVANLVGLAVTTWLTVRAFRVAPPHQLNEQTLLVLALPWCLGPWLIFAISWWRSDGWRAAARARPATASVDAVAFLIATSLSALALVPYAVSPNWMNHFLLPLWQYATLTIFGRFVEWLARLVRWSK